jgi:hypothetical protein
MDLSIISKNILFKKGEVKMNFIRNIFGKKESAPQIKEPPKAYIPAPAQPMGPGEMSMNESRATELTICMACHKQTPLPEQDAPWGTALICVHCHTPLIRHDLDDPLPTSPKRLEMFYGLRERGLEHPRCPSCRKINYAVVFPAKGMNLAWYAVEEPKNPSGFRFKVTCVHCSKDFYIEWDENPF